MSFSHVRRIRLKQPCNLKDNFLDKQDIVDVEYPDAMIEFKIGGASPKASDVFSVKIHGISRNTFNMFDVKLKNKVIIPMILEAGYKDDYGEIFVGTVESIEFSKEKNRNYVTLVGTKNSKKIKKTSLNKAWAPGTTLKKIIKDIAKESGYSIGALEIPPSLDKNFPNGYSMNETIYETLTKLVDNPKLTFKFDCFKIYVYERRRSAEEYQFINFNSGLKTYPLKDDKNIFNFSMFLNNKVSVGFVLAIPYDEKNNISDTFTTSDVKYYKVKEYMHEAIGDNTFTTTVSCELTHTEKSEADKIFKEYYENDYKIQFN